MDFEEKNQQLIKLSKTLSYRQKFVFSDEGNLHSAKFVGNEDQYDHADNKPIGLWYSVGPSWIVCLTDEYKNEDDPWAKKRITWMTHVYRLSLRKSTMCCINTEEQFDSFTNEYATKDQKRIKWGEVAKKWHGIEIKYLHNRAYGWYHGWDCSSGCIWNRKAVKSVQTVAAWKQNFSLIL